MRNTILLLLLLLLLGGVYFWLNKSDNDRLDSLSPEDRAFMVESQDDIEVLTIKNPGYPLMHMARQKNGQWILNQKYIADMYVVKNMIGVLENMEIKYIPSKSMIPRIMGELDKIGIEIKAYDANGQLLSDFIMGSNDNKELSTFCVQRGSQQPYAMYVTVAEGGLRNYFNQPQRDLRDKTVIDFDAGRIEKFSIEYFKDRKNSFEIFRKNNSYTLQALERFNDAAMDINKKTVRSYVLDQNKVVAEAIRTGEVKTDSIRRLIPFARLNYNLSDRTTAQYDFYPMKDLFLDDVNTQTVNDLKEIERYFVFDAKGDVFIVQHRMVGHIFKPIAYFLN